MKKNSQHKVDSKSVEHPHKRTPLKAPLLYRLSFFNESTLSRVWTIAMSRRRLVAYSVLLVVGIAMVGAALIAFTPLKDLLPGYLKPAERSEYVAASMRLDSIVERSMAIESYLTNIHDIMADEVNVDSLYTVTPPPVASHNDSLLKPSTAERRYVEQYLATHEFDLTSDNLAVEGLPDFVAPVKDAIVSRGATPDATHIRLSQSHQPVSSIADGVVVDVNKAGDKYTVVVQHNDGYLSRYGRLSTVYCKLGDKIVSGGRIGTVTRGDGREALLDFMLWLNGTRLQPIDYIPF